MGKRKSSRPSIIATPKRQTKSVTVKQVNNGYIISRYNPESGEDKQVIAKTNAEAMKVVNKLFKAK